MRDILHEQPIRKATGFGRPYWEQVIQAAPPEVIGYAVTMALAESIPEAWLVPGQVRPMTRLTPQQQSSLIQMVVSELEKEGFNRQDIIQAAFIWQLDPYRMSPHDINALLQWSAQQHPQVLARVATHFQEQPDILEALLGERVMRMVISSLGGATR